MGLSWFGMVKCVCTH